MTTELRRPSTSGFSATKDRRAVSATIPSSTLRTTGSTDTIGTKASHTTFANCRVRKALFFPTCSLHVMNCSGLMSGGRSANRASFDGKRGCVRFDLPLLLQVLLHQLVIYDFVDGKPSSSRRSHALARLRLNEKVNDAVVIPESCPWATPKRTSRQFSTRGHRYRSQQR